MTTIPHYERLFSLFPDEPGLRDQRYATECAEDIRRMVECVDAGTWRESTLNESFTDLFLEDVRNAQTFIDVGAERGFYAYLARAHMPPAARIIAIEPDPVRCALLEELFANDPNTTVCHSAASSRVGTITLVKPRGCSSTAADVPGDAYCVESVVLDEFLKSVHVDVIKIDVEGAEADVLDGMWRILNEDRPTLYLEYHPWVEQIRPGGAQLISDILADAHYQMHRTDQGRPTPTDRPGGRMRIVPTTAT